MADLHSLRQPTDNGATADPDRQRAFADAARAAGLDPADRWVGGYVDYEWDHLRALLEVYGVRPEGLAALEFGCNMGASGVVLARLGAEVTGVDVDLAHVRIAQANIALHGVEERARAIHVADTRAMPFADGAFDLAIANSVLEYVAPDQLAEVMAEIHRVLRPGATLLICGTASRLAPREVHSRRWLVNYLPRTLDPLFGRALQRGLSPRHLARALRGRFEVRQGARWIAARRRLHGRASVPVTLVDRLGRMLGVAPGWLGPHIELVLRRI
jgi:SAM-dependent methyltransferase